MAENNIKQDNKPFEKMMEEMPKLTLERAYGFGSVFMFGDNLLINNTVECKYLHPSKNNKHTVDIGGLWKDFPIEELSYNRKYKNQQFDKTECDGKF